uniref:Occlusion derived virus envelope protein P74 n=1 Tax=Phthorimaea operculella granulovirus TaxID=192584 RepID=A0A481SGU1_9BBAC|nr:occlusion derived virus envelope protein P74 [Phthorimaea operculella granulovirus]
MATPTQLDITNAVIYVSHRDTLSFITRWRKKFPHILINYSVKWATYEYYVPPSMRNKNGIAVNLEFSSEGCESMSCFPYTETGVIDYLHSPIGGYTQTSNTPVQYNQPACFHLDPAMAARDGNIQSVELRYQNKKCIMVDSFTKAWMNAPYIRTSRHIVKGVDDVPGFDVSYDPNPMFPERIVGKFNDAYCRRFGRSERDNGCSQPWYEIFISFVLGESIFTTFKLSAQHVFAELRDFDYARPSAVLPPPPSPEGLDMLEAWYNLSDTTVDIDRELKMVYNNEFGIASDERLVYVANKGYTILKLDEESRRLNENLLLELFQRRQKAAARNLESEKSLEDIIVEFLEDHSFLMSILTDMGFNVLESTLNSMLTQLNKVLIPALTRMLSMQTRRVTAVLLGETYKASVVHAMNRAFVSTVSTVAKASVRAISAAASIANLALTFLTIADLVLMIWDPFGYNNMFPRGYLDDLSSAFLSAYYESIDAPTRDPIEFTPAHFANLIIDDDEEYFTESMLHMADYLTSLTVNSNGQILDWDDGETVSEIDESSLVGASLAANDTWTYFKWFCKRHDKLLGIKFNNDTTIQKEKPHILKNVIVGTGILGTIFSLIYYTKNYTILSKSEKTQISTLLLILIILWFLILMLPSIQYYTLIQDFYKT